MVSIRLTNPIIHISSSIKCFRPRETRGEYSADWLVFSDDNLVGHSKPDEKWEVLILLFENCISDPFVVAMLFITSVKARFQRPVFFIHLFISEASTHTLCWNPLHLLLQARNLRNQAL